MKQELIIDNEIFIVESLENLTDLIPCFEYIKDDNYFDDRFNISIQEFIEHIIDSVVLRNSKNEIVAVSYITENNYKAILMSGFARKDYRNRKYTIPAITIAIDYYFTRYDLINRIDVIGRDNNLLSKRFCKAIGFIEVGTIPKYLPHQNIDCDYFYYTKIRGK